MGRLLLDGNTGGGGSSGGGGGTPGTPSGSTAAVVASENGGVIASTYFLLSPVRDINSGNCYFGFFDISSFDDSKDGSEYDYRVEDIDPDGVPTVNWVVIEYRDLGKATIQIVMTGVNDDGVVVSESHPATIGNVVPTNAILTLRQGFGFTAFRPQLKITRAPGAGPLDITRAIFMGEIS